MQGDGEMLCLVSPSGPTLQSDTIWQSGLDAPGLMEIFWNLFLLFWIYPSQHKQSLSSPPPNLKQLLPSGSLVQAIFLSGEPQFWHIFFWAQLADVFPSHAFRRSKVYPKMYSLPLTQGKHWKLSDSRTAAGSAKTAKTVESTWLISGRYLLKSC